MADPPQLAVAAQLGIRRRSRGFAARRQSRPAPGSVSASQRHARPAALVHGQCAWSAASSARPRGGPARRPACPAQCALLPTKQTRAPLTPQGRSTRLQLGEQLGAQRRGRPGGPPRWPSRRRTPTTGRSGRRARCPGRSTVSSARRAASRSSGSPARASNRRRPRGRARARRPTSGSPRLRWRAAGRGSPRARTRPSSCDIRTLPVSGSPIRSPSALASSISRSASSRRPSISASAPRRVSAR